MEQKATMLHCRLDETIGIAWLHASDQQGPRSDGLRGRPLRERGLGDSEPLPSNELYHLAESIHRWITTKSRMWADGPAAYEATFTLIQSARGTKSGVVRRSVQEKMPKEAGIDD